MISSCNICFAYMGYILFGDKLDAFKTFDRSYFSLLGVLVGEGPSYAQLADADGVGAFLLYVPYVLFFALIFTQLVVAVIVEAYQVPPPALSRKTLRRALGLLVRRPAGCDDRSARMHFEPFAERPPHCEHRSISRAAPKWSG
jgi:hypothetical protein